jgi:hypothetical protein
MWPGQIGLICAHHLTRVKDLAHAPNRGMLPKLSE